MCSVHEYLLLFFIVREFYNVVCDICLKAFLNSTEYRLLYDVDAFTSLLIILEACKLMHSDVVLDP